MTPPATHHERVEAAAADIDREHSIGIKALALLARMAQWDHLATAGDGPYWTAEIQGVLDLWRTYQAEKSRCLAPAPPPLDPGKPVMTGYVKFEKKEGEQGKDGGL